MTAAWIHTIIKVVIIIIVLIVLADFGLKKWKELKRGNNVELFKK